VQMEQQVMVSGAERTLFMASKWIGDSLDEERHCWHYPDLDLRAKILAGWDQFAIDLAAYVLPPTVEAAPVGKSPDTLPALRIEVTGQVTASNLAEFKSTALSAIRGVKRDLTTDSDFADASKAIAWCADVESRLKAAKEHALSQTSSIDELFRTLDDISAESKAVRLDLSKLVERRKTEVKECAVTAARLALDVHISALNAELAPISITQVVGDFAGAIKGMRSIAGMQDAIDTMLARAKITADGLARELRVNLALFKFEADGLEFLFADLGQVVRKAPDDFSTLLHSRLATHKAAEAAREEKRRADEASRIAAAEQRARQQEADRIGAEAQRQAIAEITAARAESTRLEALADANRAALATHPLAQDVCKPLSQALASKPDAPMHARHAALGINEPATLNLGAINALFDGRVSFTVGGLAQMGIEHRATAGVAKLYRRSDVARICRALAALAGEVLEAQEATA
jgi:hypothetical protein